MRRFCFNIRSQRPAVYMLPDRWLTSNVETKTTHMTTKKKRSTTCNMMKQMHPKKALGPSGMPPFFCQHYSSLVGNCAMHVVLHFLTPISLSNMVFKLASKVLANRLKVLLPQIISENQSAFINNRLITDNVLVDFEMMHCISQKKKKKRKKGGVDGS